MADETLPEDVKSAIDDLAYDGPEDTISMKKIARLRAAILSYGRAERERAERLALWIVRQHEHDKPPPWNVYDHACRECIPHGDLVVDGFQCAVHMARALSAPGGASSPSRPDDKETNRG